MSERRWSRAVAGALVLTVLSMPLPFAVRVSFSPDSFLRFSWKGWSLRWYAAFLADQRWISASLHSLLVASAADLVALLLGLPLAFAVVRHRFRGRGFLNAWVLLPACVPGAILGMGLLPVFYVLHLWGTYWGLIFAHGLLALPVAFLVTRSHLEQVNADLEAAARGLGATQWQSVWRVTLPLIRPALLAAAGAVFVFSLNESTVTIFLATPATETLPVVVWPQLRYAASPLVAVASCLSAASAILGAVLLVPFVRR